MIDAVDHIEVDGVVYRSVEEALYVRPMFEVLPEDECTAETRQDGLCRCGYRLYASKPLTDEEVTAWVHTGEQMILEPDYGLVEALSRGWVVKHYDRYTLPIENGLTW